MEKYLHMGFDKYQLNEIKLGLDSGVNVDIYAKGNYNSSQMKEIRKGLEDGIDVSSYAKAQFNSIMMRHKREELEKKTLDSTPSPKRMNIF